MRPPPARLPLLAIVAAALVVAACSGGPILANPPITYPSPPTETARPSRQPDPIPVELPRDDGPHHRLTEWWYYTGHLSARDGRKFGFEAVVFRAERGSVPTAWASHLALTDESGNRFAYAQRSEIGPQVDRSPRGADGLPTGFDLQVAGLSPDLIDAGAPASAAPWRLAGSGGADRIVAQLAPAEAAAAGRSFGFDLTLDARREAALHDGDGFVDFGPAGSSYYYSRTSVDAVGLLELDGERIEVEGSAWFDHQWGDFISVGGGWDWFAVNVRDGRDLTVSVIRDGQGEPVLIYGTLIDKAGNVTHLQGDSIRVEVLPNRPFVSPRTGRTYQLGWRLVLPDHNLTVELEATVADQELDTRATTGVAYWEGSQQVQAIVNGPRGPIDVGGEAYVEMTRYGG